MHVALTPSRIVTLTSPSFLNTKNVDAVPKDPMAFKNEYSGCQTWRASPRGTRHARGEAPMFWSLLNASLESGRSSCAGWPSDRTGGLDTDFIARAAGDFDHDLGLARLGRGWAIFVADANIAVRTPPVGRAEQVHGCRSPVPKWRQCISGAGSDAEDDGRRAARGGAGDDWEHRADATARRVKVVYQYRYNAPIATS